MGIVIASMKVTIRSVAIVGIEKRKNLNRGLGMIKNKR
jgi:hypothetical protein